MLAQRIAQSSLRKTASTSCSSLPIRTLIPKRATTFSLSMQTRLAATQIIKPSENNEILISQRKNRPTSPHLAIYRPQITWYLSALNRITGCAVSGGFYLFGLAYLVSPVLGWNLGSASLVAAFGALPLAAKVILKSLVALPFTFHSFNGLRHLTWDMGVAFTNQAVIKSGWTVVGLSLASAFGLVAYVWAFFIYNNSKETWHDR